jgi:hypothetical protein
MHASNIPTPWRRAIATAAAIAFGLAAAAPSAVAGERSAAAKPFDGTVTAADFNY